jgi:protein ImuB
LVLVATVASRQVIIVACPLAMSRGVKPTMTLAEAAALCAGLIHREYRPDQDRKALQALARWMGRFSPIVAVEPPDALMLDVTGSERLFGGLDRLWHLASESLSGLALEHGLCIAPTPGAAWAIASFGGSDQKIVGIERLKAALMPLPVAALRLEGEFTHALCTLGIGTIGQLMELPRVTLPSRFGAILLQRLDQALGGIHEVLLPVEQRTPIQTELRFEGTVESLQVIEEALRHVLDQTIGELKRRACGARKLAVEFLNDRSPSIQKTISLSRPTCDRAALFNLLRCATDTAKGGDGFIGVRLSVPVYERLSHEQLDLLGSPSQAGELEFVHLIEHLRVRLGDEAVVSAQLSESHLPEKTWKCVDALTGDSAAALEDQRQKARPLHLLEPLEVRCMASQEGLPISFVFNGDVFTVASAAGPERIAAVWWEGRNKTRDYFDVEETGGRRFWLFRVLETHKWYLHGIFDC